MNDLIVIDTEQSTTKAVPQEKYELLKVYGEDYSLLREKLPEFDLEELRDPVIQNIIKKLKATMHAYAGLGLSANQCGYHMRMFVIGTDQFQITCINPKVVWESDNKVKRKEGCLSFPGLALSIDRPETIGVEYYNEKGELKQETFTGTTAQCFLHELDHLNGIRMIDHVKPVALQMAKKRQKKIMKMIKRNTR